VLARCETKCREKRHVNSFSKKLGARALSVCSSAVDSVESF
jgi:hypothetical protein